MNVPELLREWQEKHGYCHRAAAAAIGVPRGTYIQWLKGRRRPDQSGRTLIAKVLGVESEVQS